ncbi:hypothetical protein BVRB_7g169560 [Beta vulgaris subsp. vulgaris]|uniref:trihelix transcription factor ASIL2 n=1 Tax=Beta vulgaris subsp. vulgaris TaxID=3555 RepID=UPI00053FF36B|nr:trihelix transcription factor ASIL2 [Beta vulgaris subsp. vulgaris]KMT04779.1 hypothetical protein BVRB_7g169560 [Beta vulgaris subsp. vulgaris]
MDEDEEIRSPSSPPPESPPPAPITVTVAAAPPSSTQSPLTPQTPSSLTLALPIQQFPRPLAITYGGITGAINGGSSGGSGGGGGGREDCWSEGATSVLIDAWGERYMELSRGNLKQKHWKEVADIVSSREDYGKAPKTDIQCKNRIDTVKKKYKIEKAKISSGCGPSRWAFFERLDRLIGGCSGSTPSPNPGVIKGSGLSGVTVTPATATVSTGGPVSKAVPVGIPVVRNWRPPSIDPKKYMEFWQREQQRVGQRQVYGPGWTARPNHMVSQPMSNQTSNGNGNGNGNSNSNAASTPACNYNSYMSIQEQARLMAGGRLRPLSHLPPQPQPRPQSQPQPPVSVDTDSDQEAWSNDSADSLPPERPGFERRKRPRMDVDNRGGERGNVKGKGKGSENGNGREKKAAVRVWGNSVRELTRAILKFGEAYETAESTKLQHVVEMEMQRMKFAKELELQRMKFMMKTQLEISQLNGNGSNNSDSRGGGSGGIGGGENNRNNNNRHHLHGNHLNHANSDSSN